MAILGFYIFSLFILQLERRFRMNVSVVKYHSGFYAEMLKLQAVSPLSIKLCVNTRLISGMK